MTGPFIAVERNGNEATNWINAANITQIADRRGYTRVHFADDRVIGVKGTADQLVRRIREAIVAARQIDNTPLSRNGPRTERDAG